MEHTWNARQPVNAEKQALRSSFGKMHINHETTLKTTMLKRHKRHLEIHSPFYQTIHREYDQYIRARNLVIKGQGVFQLYVKEFLCWLESQGVHRITKVTSSLMIDYLEYLNMRPNLIKEGTLSDSTINIHLYSLRMLMDYLLDTKQIESAVLIPDNSIGSKKEREALTVQEMDLLYSCCQSKKERAILSAAYGCGLRRSELEALKTLDINFLSGILVVREGKGRKRRDVPMSDAVIDDLRSYLIEERHTSLQEHSYLEASFFIHQNGKRMKGSDMADILKEIVLRTNNYQLMQKDINLHNLRHSISMHLIDNGADMEFIRDFLGHSEIDTSYIYARKNKKRQQTIHHLYDTRNH